jgi:PAS domain-containing protein
MTGGSIWQRRSRWLQHDDCLVSRTLPWLAPRNTADLAEALESETFEQFLDHIPVAVAVSELRPSERIIHVNLEFERASGRTVTGIQGQPRRAVTSAASASHNMSQQGDVLIE